MGMPGAPLAEGESFVLVLRPHVRRLAVPTLVLLVLAPLVGVALGVVPPGDNRGRVQLIIAGLGVVAAARWVLLPFLQWWNTVYALTTARIMAYRGVLTRSGHEVPLGAVVDVAVEQRLLERMLGSGTLVVSSEAGLELALADVPQVVAVQRALRRLADDATDVRPYPGAVGPLALGSRVEEPDDDPDDDPDAPDDDPWGAARDDDPWGAAPDDDPDANGYLDDARYLDDLAVPDPGFPRPQPPGRRLFGRRR